jgi:hypothetical protein
MGKTIIEDQDESPEARDDREYSEALDAFKQHTASARDGLDDDGEGSEYDETAHEEMTTEEVNEMLDSLTEEQRHVFERLFLSKKKDKQEGKGKKGSVASKDEEWHPANNLQAPKARPGMAQRWVRFAIGNTDDPRNWSRSQREGWTPRSLETVPAGFNAPTMAHPGGTGSVIAIGDLILCEMPIARFISRKKYFKAKLERLLAAMQKRPLSEAERSGQGPAIKVTSKKSVTYARGQRTARATEE